MSIAGVLLPTHRTGSNAFTTWLLGQQRITLREGTVRWRDSQRAAPEIAFKRLQLAIRNEESRHRLSLQAPADGDVLHGPLDFRTDFRHEPFSAMGAPANWTGRLYYLSTGSVDLPTLARYIRIPLTMYGGCIDNRIWLDFARGQLQGGIGRIAGRRYRPARGRHSAASRSAHWPLRLDAAEARRHVHAESHDLYAELGQQALSDGTPISRLLASKTLQGVYRPAAVGKGQMFRAAGDRVDLGILAEFLRALPLPARVQNEFVRFNPRGQIADYTIYTEHAPPKIEEDAKHQREQGDAPLLHYAFKSELQGISVQAQEPPPGLTVNNHPRAGIPGVENLWGKVDANEAQGSIDIDTKNAAVTIPGAFDDQRLTFDALKGHARWTASDNPAPGMTHRAFTIQLDTLHLKTPDAESEVKSPRRTGIRAASAAISI